MERIYTHTHEAAQDNYMRERIELPDILPRMKGASPNIADIVRQLLALEGAKQSDLADELDVEQPTVSRWLGGSEPRGPIRDKILALAAARGLLPGGRVANKGAQASRFVSVPIVSWVSAGKLMEPAITPPDDAPKLAVADLGEGDFFALKVSGTSMDRISPDKSIIIVNRAARALQDGKPYVFCIRGEVTYKLWRSQPPRLEPYTTDPSNETIYVDRRHAVGVVGRVRRSILDL